MSPPGLPLRIVVHERRPLVRDRLIKELESAHWVVSATAYDDTTVTEADGPSVLLCPAASAPPVSDLGIGRIARFDDRMSVEAVLATTRREAEADPADDEQLPPVVPAPARLTAREAAVLEAIADGKSTAQIAARLSLAPKSVEGHKRRIFTKLNVQSSGHAVAVFRGYSVAAAVSLRSDS